MSSAPRIEMIGHHPESTVGDITRYVRTLHATASKSATVSDNRLNWSTTFLFAWTGVNRKKAHPTIPTTGSKMRKETIIVAL